MKKYYYLYIFVCYAFYACKHSPESHPETTVGHPHALIKQKITSDTIPDIDPEKDLQSRKDIRMSFLSLPSEYLESQGYPAPTITMRKDIVKYKAAPPIRDVVVDTLHAYLFYNLQQNIGSTHAGKIVEMRSFPYKNGEELLVVKHDIWSETQVETTDIHFLKQDSLGKWMSINKNEIFPNITLQDFFKSDISDFLKEADHNALPVLCLELPRNGKRIKAFLGEWKHKSESFHYEPDIDYIEIIWKENKFHKLGIAQDLE